MIRSRPRRRVLRLVVSVLVTLLVAPFAEADDYAFLHGGPPTAHEGFLQVESAVPDATSDDGLDGHVCSCLVCLMTLGESFEPRVPAPQPGEAVDPATIAPSCVPHLPRVFHPPIA